MARPRKKIDPDQVMKLAQLGCPINDIAWVLNCHRSVLDKKYINEIEKGKAQSRTRLRQLMWQSAEKGNTAIQIFMAKNILGFQDANGPEENLLTAPIGQDQPVQQFSNLEIINIILERRAELARPVEEVA